MTKILGIRDIEHYHWQLAEADSPFFWSGNGSSLSLAAAIELACIEASRKADKMSLPAPAVTITNCPIWSLVNEARWPDRQTGKAKLRNGSIVVVVLPSDGNDPW
jgi:hypothetical protein